MFDWNDLKTFLAVARNGSTLGAAKALGVNPTTVARRIEALEAAVGLKLFERDQLGTRLTEAGQDLVAEAERLEEAADGFVHRAAAHQRGVAGSIRVTSTEILANLAITPGLAAFRELYPDLKVDLLITDDQLDLERGEADIALRAGLALPESDLIARKIGTFPFGLYASRDYLLRKGLPAGIEDLRHHDLIAGDGPASPLPAVEWMFAQVPGVQPAARSNSMTNLLHALKVGMGVGPIGCLVGDLEPELVRIMVVPDILPSAWIVTRRELKDVPRVRAFIDFLVPHFTQLQKSMIARGEVAQRERMAELKAALAAGQTA